MKAYKTTPIPSSEITPSNLFHARRKFMQLAGGASLAALLPSSVWAGNKLADIKKSAYSVQEDLTPYKDVIQYNNFYEFGTSKEEPANNADSLKTRPWTVTVGGEVKNRKCLLLRNC
jgi:methionine sulfoxide reductase catalytic subunit